MAPLIVFLAMVFGSLFFSADQAEAEPWMANRFSQNCAACHAPGRLNRAPSKRRCTLSCQGCHVNPNGGGLRNHYGKWNSQRWVRSFYSDLTWGENSPAPLEKQLYARKKLSEKMKAKMAKRGAPLVGFPEVVKDEKAYFESSNYVAAKDEIDELSRMTRNDPYRTERSESITAGGDLRLFWIQQSGNGAASQKLREGAFYPMVFDYAVRVRPIKEKLSFVYEGRAANSNVPNPSSLDNLFNGTNYTRSAYALVDDLWYNSYFQYGIYRPMFGIFNPNHNALINKFTNLDQLARVKAAGFGTAPNVPFAIFNYIMPMENVAVGGANTNGLGLMDEAGFNLSLGLRFVSYGAHLVGSYWSTAEQQGINPLNRDMWNINGGFVLGRFIFNGEMTSVSKEKIGKDSIKVVGADVRYRFWREMYAQLGYTQANAAVDYPFTAVSQTGIAPGSASEMAFGLRAFTISGLEFEALMTNQLNKQDGQEDRQENTLQFQMHAYY